MNHLDPQKKIFDEFRKTKRRQILFLTPLAILLAVITNPEKLNLSKYIDISGDNRIFIVIIFLVGMFIFSFINWRCPACNKYLGAKNNPRFCSACGAQLKE